MNTAVDWAAFPEPWRTLGPEMAAAVRKAARRLPTDREPDEFRHDRRRRPFEPLVQAMELVSSGQVNCAQLAREVGVSEKSAWEWINRGVAPNANALGKLAKWAAERGR